MHRKTVLAGTALVAAVSLAPQIAAAQAAAAPEPSPLTANVTLTSLYKFRGQDQDVLGSNGNFKTSSVKPALQGGFDYAHSSGFYVGNWNSSVGWLDGNSIESDLYGGFKFQGGPIAWDVGVLGYIYPGATAGNTVEIYGSGTYDTGVAGAFTAKYSHTVSDDYFNYAGNDGGSGLKGTNTGYFNLAWAMTVAGNVTLKAAVGYTHLSSDIRGLGYPSFYDYSVGAAYDFGGGLSLGAMVQGASDTGAYEVTGADGRTVSPNKARFIVALTKTL
ncbi:MAG TPA: TorF family putative porin [Variovorax sp.]|nr:TorF family putative porin [Variovorax sp.]HYP85170.1 TorF family putative porin [Variovorax sp.]